ncbi:MAG: esterase-like activity of phytase family protein [Verrucomicrobiota bacterium]|nr:esterase-like activity of phytase family protein [Verrucomicrobiota bacterium]
MKSIALLLFLVCILSGCATSGHSPQGTTGSTFVSNADRRLFTLKAEKVWRLDQPNGVRFDASGLLLRKTGELWVVSDRGSRIYQIDLPDSGIATLASLPDFFPDLFMRQFLTNSRPDCEGLAQDENGFVYICEESSRSIFRRHPDHPTPARLAIDWTPVARHFHPSDRNMSFEGIAQGQGKLWVVNERSDSRIIEIDLKNLKVIADFDLNPSNTLFGEVQYSDLSWHGGYLYVLCRHHQAILQMEPATRRVVAEFDYSQIEEAAENVYLRDFPTGTMEGLAVDSHYIWLITDNNGKGRRQDPADTRPTLFKCPRPDVPGSAQ